MKREQEASGAEKAGSLPEPNRPKGRSTAPSRSPSLMGLQHSAGNRAVAERMGGAGVAGMRSEPLAVQRTLESALRDRLQGASDEDIADTIVKMFKGSGLDTNAAKFAGSATGTPTVGGSGLGSTPEAKAASKAELLKKKADLQRQLRYGSLNADESLTKEVKGLETRATTNQSLIDIKQEVLGRDLTRRELAQIRGLDDKEAQRQLEEMTEKQTKEKGRKARAKEISELEHADEADIESEAKLNFLRDKQRKKVDYAKDKLENQEIAKGLSPENINTMMQNDAVKNNPMLQKWAKMQRKSKSQ